MSAAVAQSHEEDGEKPESEFKVFLGWLYYRVDSALAIRSNQFKLLVFVLLFTNAILGNIFYFCGGMYGKHVGDTTYLEAFWDVWALIMDTGIQYYALYTMPRFVAALSTVMGLLFAAVLTGFVVDAVMEKMNDLRKGKSVVKEWGHTLLIGCA